MQAGAQPPAKAGAARKAAGAGVATEHPDDPSATIRSLYEFLILRAKHYATNLSEDHREAAVLASLWDACTTPTGSDLILNDDTGPLLHKLWNLVAYDKQGHWKPLSQFLHWALGWPTVGPSCGLGADP